MTKTISIGENFSRFPGGRYKTDGPYNGERFREEILIPELLANKKLLIRLDDTVGYGSSFLEEAFGGIVRAGILSATELQAKLELISEDDILKEKVWSYITTAKKTK